MNNVLTKVIVARFYQVNAGFFLALFLLLFGIMSGKETVMFHYAIMQAIMGSWLFLSLAMALWMLYNVKCISFCLKELDRPENSFLFNLQAISDRQQFKLLAACYFELYLPVIIYGTITLVIGVKEAHYLTAATFLLFQLAMCLAGALVCFYTINGTWKKPAFTLPSLDPFPRKNISSSLLHFSLSQRKGTFIAIKLFSILLLQIMVAANAEKESREAVCVLIMFLISAHALLPMYYVRFMEKELSFLRNTSLSLMRRFFIYVLTYAVIFIPELLFLLWNERAVLSLQVIFSLYALAVSQLSLYTSILYIKKVTTERYTTVIFAIFFITLLLLAALSLWFVFLAESVLAIILFLSLYWNYEMIEAKSE